jgi:hypothetical protein
MKDSSKPLLPLALAAAFALAISGIAKRASAE